MATFTIDLLTGDLYLFTGDFTGSGGTPTSGSTYPEVNTVSELPTPASSYNGQIYVVRTGTGDYVLNRKDAGLYISISNTWRRLGDTPAFFDSNNFEVYDTSDTTKGFGFVTSGITSGIFRQVKIQDASGTVAYLTDIDTKLDTNIFADYTGTTAPNTYLSISDFNTYSGITYNLIQSKQDLLTAGIGISIDSGNTISVDLPSTLQLVDEVGSVNVNNIVATPIDWTTQVFSGTSLNYSGGSRIYIQADDVYGISYALNVNSDSNSDKNIGTLIRKNGNTDITTMSSASFSSNFQNDSSTNMMPEHHVTLKNGDYIELVAFRIGYAGQVYTVANGSWIKIQKKIT